jgi:hypothetical protein
MALAMPWTPCLSITSVPDPLRQLVQSRTDMLRTLAENSRLFSESAGAEFSLCNTPVLLLDLSFKQFVHVES